MKNIWLSGVALAALVVAGSAHAADLNSAPVYKAPPLGMASSWTGFYAGLGLGYRATRTDATTTSETRAGVQQDLTNLALSQPLDGTGVRASPYVGFNWQFAPQWVAGIEGDAGFAGQTSTLGGFAFTPAFPTFESADSLAVKTTWDAGMRGRLGYLLTPTTLAYATGGAAWQHYEVTSTCADPFCVTAGFAPAVVTNATTKLGWTVGGGLETALWGHWLARAEYRYADFGTSPFTIARSSNIPAGNPTVDTLDVRMRTHTVTFGLAYKFGDPVAGGNLGSAFAMKAPPAMVSWSGPYVGFGLGARASRADLTTTSVTQGGTNVSLTNRPTSLPFDGTGFRASPYAGYNWQFAPQWLAGIEGDIGFAKQTTTRAGFGDSTFSPTSDAPDGLAVKATWDASLRGRFGYLLTPATLAYATAGAAWQHYEVTSTCAGAFCIAVGYAPVVVTNSTTKAGWTVGGGIETMLWGNWLARAEYRYADFGSVPFTIVRSSSAIAGRNPTVDNFDVRLRTHTVTFGLAYKFN